METDADLAEPRFGRLFASESGAPRIRRLVDVIALGLAIALLALLVWWLQPTTDFEASLADTLATSPAWLHGFWVVIYDGVLVLGVAVAVAAIVRRRWPIVLQGAIAALTAVVVVAVTARWASGSWGSVSAVVGSGAGVTWPAAALAVAAAPLFAVASDLVQPARRLGMRMLVAGGIACVLAGRATPSGVIAALAAAAAAAAIARLAVGTTAGHLRPATWSGCSVRWG